MTPQKTVCFKEGVMLVEEVKAPKTTGTVEERLDELEDKTFRYGTVVYRSLDAHHFMNLELEKKVEEYKKRLEDLEDRYKYGLKRRLLALVLVDKGRKARHLKRRGIEIDIHFVREKVSLGEVRVLHVPSALQFADVMTKGLPSQVFLDFRSSLCV